LARVRTQLKDSQAKERDEKLLALLRTLKEERNGQPENLHRIPLKQNGTISFLDVKSIEWISAQGNYVELHTATGHHLLRETMDGIESKLDPAKFVRLRRSVIARIDQIKFLHPLARAEYDVVLRNGKHFQSSRRYRRNLDVLLKS
jgi:two-component system LytT family response regulator